MDALGVAAATVGATAVASVATNEATNCVTRIKNFKDNHKSLEIKMSDLRALRDDVNSKIQAAEDNSLMRTAEVGRWLNRVEEISKEVDLILQDGSRHMDQRCGLLGCYPNNWWVCYKHGKKLIKMLVTVEQLMKKGHFDVVAVNFGLNPVQVLPESQTVGQDELFADVWKLLGDDEVKILGIYGMAGVGKTTLMTKLHNALSNEAHRFDIVIWVVVSKDFSIRNVQKEIGRRLGLIWNGDEEQSEKAVRIFNALRRKKFMLMLDDIWKPMELEAIGIPSPRATATLNGSKLVFTTRSEEVCGRMELDKKVKVPPLDWNHSWNLFQDKVGQEALESHPEIPKLAAEVAKECGGLPLVLIVIAKAMASKKTPHEWKHAIKTLQRNAAEFSGMEEKVLATLKFSYDNLENDTVKSCFIYFSLYPEDYNVIIDQIIHQWIGEGFLDEFEDMDDAIDKGHDIIGSLKAACLLECGLYERFHVKMHDVVRDLALWIGRERGQKKSTFMVQAGAGLTQAPNIESWKGAERISLMWNDLTELSNSPECPYLLTLLLQSNGRLSSIATDFFQYMPCLRVLALSALKITDVPKSIGTLRQLQYLDLSETGIKALPEELGNLVQLRYLNLSHTLSLADIPRKMAARFSRLQFLDLYGSGTRVDGNICHPGLEDLESLEHMKDLGITVREFAMLNSVLHSHKLSACLTKLCISNCQGLTKLALAPSSSSILGNMKKLCHLRIKNCSEMEELAISSVEEDNNIRLLQSLETLELGNLPKVNIIWSETCTPTHFNNLIWVKIEGCDGLRDLSWLVLVPFLKVLAIISCNEVEEIIVNEFAKTTVDNQTIFSRLEVWYLLGLPKLKSICFQVLPFPSLRMIQVAKCPLLKKLPFEANSTKEFSISCETEWWDALQWEDQTVESSFQMSSGYTGAGESDYTNF